MNQIAQTGTKNCFKHGISVMRLALGYDNEGFLDTIEDGGKVPSQMLELVGRCFPNHKVKVACCKREAKAIPSENCTYIGSRVSDEFDWDNHLVGFSYHTPESYPKGHFVIGMPQIYPGMESSFMVAVEIGEV